jgi:hypothetical protein
MDMRNRLGALAAAAGLAAASIGAAAQEASRTLSAELWRPAQDAAQWVARGEAAPGAHDLTAPPLPPHFQPFRAASAGAPLPLSPEALAEAAATAPVAPTPAVP